MFGRLNVKMLSDMLKRTSSLSAPSSCQGNSITANCSLHEPLSTQVIFGHILFQPRPCSRRRPGQSDWGSERRVGRVRGCLLQHWASVIRTVQGWKDNRQNNVLFKDGSPPLFLKVERRPEEAGLNTREQERRAVLCRLSYLEMDPNRISRQSKMYILNAQWERCKEAYCRQYHILISVDIKLFLF